jgi:hypothetical protein
MMNQPKEVILEIGLWVDYKTVQNLRRVSTRFNYILDNEIIWKHLFQLMYPNKLLVLTHAEYKRIKQISWKSKLYYMINNKLDVVNTQNIEEIIF